MLDKYNFMTQKILDKLIRPQFRTKLNDWCQYSKQNQTIGLDIITQIYNSKGNRHVNVTLPQEKSFYQTHNSMMTRKSVMSLEEAEELYRRKQLTSTYQYHHGYSLHKPKTTNIFEFKTLHKMDLAKYLTPTTVSFIDNWLVSGDRKEYQEYVLACLRSIKSKIEVANAGSTETKTSFNWRPDPKLSQPLRMDKICEDLFAYKPNVVGIQRQNEKQRKIKERVAELQKTQFAQQLKIFKDFKIN